MSLKQFFEEILGATLNNARWSWGAIEDGGNRVFLRVWEDQIRRDSAGERVQVYWTERLNNSPGYSERLRHLDAIRSGADAFGVLTRVADANAEGTRQIDSFDSEILLELGELSEEPDGTFARLNSRIPVNKVVLDQNVRPEAPVLGLDDFASYFKAVLEGRVKTISVEVRARCHALLRYARQLHRGQDGKIRCQVCGWGKPDDRIAGDIVEFHHLRQIADLPAEGLQLTMQEAIKRLVPLCPCCHRIAHAGIDGKPLTPEQLKQIVPKYGAK